MESSNFSKYKIALHGTDIQIKAILKKTLFHVPARITFGERIKNNFIFYFIEFDVLGTKINCFSGKADSFCPLL